MRKMPSNAMAKELGVTEKSVSYWRTGEKQPRTENCRKIAKLLNVNAAWLTYGEGAPELEGSSTQTGSPLIKAIRSTLDVVSQLNPKEAELVPILQALVSLRESCESRTGR